MSFGGELTDAEDDAREWGFGFIAVIWRERDDHFEYRRVKPEVVSIEPDTVRVLQETIAEERRGDGQQSA